MSILRHGLLCAATFLLMLGCLGGVSGCSGKPADGTQVEAAGPPTDEQKAQHKKYYDRSSKQKANKAGTQKAGRR